jgi:hypothetical protein
MSYVCKVSIKIHRIKNI